MKLQEDQKKTRRKNSVELDDEMEVRPFSLNSDRTVEADVAVDKIQRKIGHIRRNYCIEFPEQIFFMISGDASFRLKDNSSL